MISIFFARLIRNIHLFRPESSLYMAHYPTLFFFLRILGHFVSHVSEPSHLPRAQAFILFDPLRSRAADFNPRRWVTPADPPSTFSRPAFITARQPRPRTLVSTSSTAMASSSACPAVSALLPPPFHSTWLGIPHVTLPFGLHPLTFWVAVRLLVFTLPSLLFS